MTKIYYAFLVLLTLGMITHTIFVGSQYVAYGQKVATLETEKKLAFAEEQDLRQQVATEVSIASTMQLAQNEGFIAIPKLVEAQQATKVAMR